MKPPDFAVLALALAGVVALAGWMRAAHLARRRRARRREIQWLNACWDLPPEEVDR